MSYGISWGDIRMLLTKMARDVAIAAGDAEHIFSFAFSNTMSASNSTAAEYSRTEPNFSTNVGPDQIKDDGDDSDADGDENNKCFLIITTFPEPSMLPDASTTFLPTRHAFVENKTPKYCWRNKPNGCTKLIILRLPSMTIELESNTASMALTEALYRMQRLLDGVAVMACDTCRASHFNTTLHIIKIAQKHTQHLLHARIDFRPSRSSQTATRCFEQTTSHMSR